MADYSRYGGTSPDWTAYMDANPQPQQPSNLNVKQLQEMTNAGREANSREILKMITGTCFVELPFPYLISP
jgi:hypothetical protein